MNINYWGCKYNNYEEYWDSEGNEETRIYGCLHPKGCGICSLENKYCGDKVDCPLLDEVLEVG